MIRQINDFKNSINQVLGYRAKKCLEIIKFYEENNPDLPNRPPRYSDLDNMQTKRYFQDINNAEKAYWFGFLCADGCVQRNRNRIIFELAEKDRERIESFARELKLDPRRIKSQTRLYSYRGVRKSLKTCRISFSSKEMKSDLEIHDLKRFPNFIALLIEKAKNDAGIQGGAWTETQSSRVALAWLLGYFDGDGTYLGKYQAGESGRIYSTNKFLLENIKSAFSVRNDVRPSGSIDQDVLLVPFHSSSGNTYISHKQSYYLTLGSEIFKAMMGSYRNSMVRKRSPSLDLN